MKLPILFLLSILFFSCSKTETTSFCSTLNCGDDANCLFTRENIEGTVTFVNCYQRWGIQTDEDSTTFWSIPDNMPSSFEKEGLSIIYCAYFRENKLDLVLPDPGLMTIYQSKLEAIEIK